MKKANDFRDKHIPYIAPISIALIVICVLYAAWEYYWYTRVNYACIKWHTHLMLYFYPLLFLLLLWHFKKGVNDTSTKVFLAVAAILFSLFIAEGLLLISGIYKTTSEKNQGYYQSFYLPQDRNYYHTWPPGKPHRITKPEYSYERPTNSLGFGDAEWVRTGAKKKKTILALGDSFTEGDGAPYDSSYISLLRTLMNCEGDSCFIMNAGVCGSDPFFNYMVFKDRLRAYQPDVIIQSVGSGDLDTDILLRGGMERFQQDSTVKYTSAPWWEPIYAVSDISRIFFRAAGYNETLRKKTITPEDKNRIDQEVKELFITYDSLCRKNNIKLIVILHPEKSELIAGHYKYDLMPLFDNLSVRHDITVIDLLPSYLQYIDRSHNEASAYYWPEDGHHNSRGYEMMATTTYENIAPLLSGSGGKGF